MSDLYERMAREGAHMRVLPWNSLTRAQKDQAREDERVHILNGVNSVHVVAILMADLPDDVPPIEVAPEAPEDETPVLPPNTPQIPEDLDVLTVAQLKELAETEEIDISDVKLKADIVGRIWGVREMRAEAEKENS